MQRLGRYDEALRWYQLNGARLLAPVLLASSHYHRGEIYEAMGDREKAQLHYRAFVELWRDADPQYQPVVQKVRRRLVELSGEG